MNSIDYIINTLKEWEIKFPNIIVRYAYEKDTAYHVITVEPNELYQNNPEYINAENHLWDSFSERYPDEDILISEPKHSLEMTNILYTTRENIIVTKQDIPYCNNVEYPSSDALSSFANIITCKSFTNEAQDYSINFILQQGASHDSSYFDDKHYNLAA